LAGVTTTPVGDSSVTVTVPADCEVNGIIDHVPSLLTVVVAVDPSGNTIEIVLPAVPVPVTATGEPVLEGVLDAELGFEVVVLLCAFAEVLIITANKDRVISKKLTKTVKLKLINEVVLFVFVFSILGFVFIMQSNKY
jgi:hypothetical protein